MKHRTCLFSVLYMQIWIFAEWLKHLKHKIWYFETKPHQQQILQTSLLPSYLIIPCNASGQFSGNRTTKNPKQMMIMPANFIPSKVELYQSESKTKDCKNHVIITEVNHFLIILPELKGTAKMRPQVIKVS